MRASRPGRSCLLLASVLALAFATRAGAVTPATTLTLTGYARITPGMTVAQAGTRLGVDLELDALPGSPCGAAGFRTNGVRGYALFINRRLRSLWFWRGVRTDRDVGIGSTAAALARAYPRSRSRPDHYAEGGRNVFVRRVAAPHWRFRFDVSPKGKVTMVAFGNETVFYVEGCL